ncbi:hypothetical protein LIER_20529 [Lithospermum erythrorhizon]|uniref:Uncharacterized protein n=1 Tax=Lithospermum erythrorhizon TaxID=34254 RepID=A0AAV3QPL9_LITER
MDLASHGVILLEEYEVSANEVTTALVIVKLAEVKMLKDFWERKLEPGKIWGDYSSDSDGEDSERPCHVYLEVDDAPVADEKKPEALQVEKKGPQDFAVTFTYEDLLKTWSTTGHFMCQDMHVRSGSARC